MKEILKNNETNIFKKTFTIKTESTKNTIEVLKNFICDNWLNFNVNEKNIRSMTLQFENLMAIFSHSFVRNKA